MKQQKKTIMRRKLEAIKYLYENELFTEAHNLFFELGHIEKKTIVFAITHEKNIKLLGFIAIGLVEKS